MMLPVSRFKGQPVGLVTTTRPWLSVSTDPFPHRLWLTSWSAETYQTTPPPVFYPPAVWIPGHTHLTQWERPAVEVVPLFSPFYCSSNLYSPHPLPKLADTWITPDEVGRFQGIDKPLLLTNQMIQRPRRHAPQICLLLSPQFSGCSRRDATKMQYTEPEDLSSSSSFSSLASSSSLLHLLSLSQFQLIDRAPRPTVGGDYSEQAGLTSQGVGPLVLTSQQCRRACLRPIISHIIQSTPTQHGVFGPISPQLYTNRWPVLPVQVMKEIHPSIFSSHFSSRFTLLTDYRHNKQGMNGRKRSFLLTTKKTTDNKQCVGVLTGGERPVASTPVPGSPWCVVWTGDDRVFFFNPTIHLSVWERPGDLIGRDISSIIEDPPHKRKRTTRAKTSSSCKSTGHHDDDKDDDHEHDSKRNRMEEPMSDVPCPGEVKLLPLNIRVAHFREMMLERGVSAFSTWEKELHKMVFDPRYLLLTSEQRKQEFDQFVKRRLKDEYKEKKSKLQKAREEFKQLLEEAKITSRSTFKEFCACYRVDQRFNALNRKKEQEVLFQHYITSLKKRDKENRARLRKMR